MNKNSGTILTEVESKDKLRKSGINVTDTRLATSRELAIKLSNEMGYPVALKLISPDITHKSDAGGVKLALETSEQVSKAFEEIMTSVKTKYPQAKIQGVSVQKMAKPGLEVIIGMTKDPQFGPVLMFGLGGIFVEIMKDVAFRVIPLTPDDAHEMITEIKGYPLLNGFRGQEPANISILENLLLKVSQFVENNPDIKELDMNPVFASSTDVVAVDARIVMENPV